MKRSGLAGALAICAAALGGCGVDLGGRPAESNIDPTQVGAGGTRSDGIGRIGDLFGTDRAEERPGERLQVNRYLWQASLDTLEFLPLASTDPFSGVIATDWSVSPTAQNERYKVAVRITSPRLEARSVNVAVYREQRSNDVWVPVEVSDATPRQIEDAILTRARQLRVADLETNG